VYRVALTGNIASGKSAVAGVWRRLGAAIIDADELARRAVAPGSSGLRRVVDLFGPQVVTAEGTLDRAAVRRIVFRDIARRRALEAILFPEIARLRNLEEERLRERGIALAVHVIPLLFEAGLADAFDAIVLVDAPEPVRIERLVRERGLPRDEAQAMIAAQMPAAAKRARATIVIENDGTTEELEAKAEQAWAQISRQ
jgi:dephospho-CoA kinase